VTGLGQEGRGLGAHEARAAHQDPGTRGIGQERADGKRVRARMQRREASSPLPLRGTRHIEGPRRRAGRDDETRSGGLLPRPQGQAQGCWCGGGGLGGGGGLSGGGFGGGSDLGGGGLGRGHGLGDRGERVLSGLEALEGWAHGLCALGGETAGHDRLVDDGAVDGLARGAGQVQERERQALRGQERLRRSAPGSPSTCDDDRCVRVSDEVHASETSPASRRLGTRAGGGEIPYRWWVG
jgi:hypothetical protein